MKKIFCAITLAITVLAVAGCQYAKGAKFGYNSVSYETEKYATTLSKVDTATTDTQHFRAVVIAKDGAPMPQIEGSVVNIPGGKQADFIIR